jgi:hypothetical protein
MGMDEMAAVYDRYCVRGVAGRRYLNISTANNRKYQCSSDVHGGQSRRAYFGAGSVRVIVVARFFTTFEQGAL